MRTIPSLHTHGAIRFPVGRHTIRCFLNPLLSSRAYNNPNTRARVSACVRLLTASLP